MATASDYNVTFPYGATSPPYSPGSPHKGNDRKCPRGTEIRILGVLVGYTGNTGWTTGPHLHTQAGTDIGCQNTVNPALLEFKPGKVVRLRTTDPGTKGSWGKFFTMQVGSQFITYAHLDSVNVSVGQVISAPTAPNPPQGGTNVVLTAADANAVYKALLKREGDAGGIKNYTGKTLEFMLNDMVNSEEFKRINTKTVEKVVEKIVEKPVPGSGKALKDYKLGEFFKELGL